MFILQYYLKLKFKEGHTMTKKLQKLSKEIAAKINKLDDLAGEVRSQFDNFLGKHFFQK